MLNINSTLIAGNLTRDPEHKTIGQNKNTRFAIASNERWKDGTETKERTTFVEIECWGRTAELAAQYLTKGSPALIEGRIQQSTWETPEGQKRSRVFVRADKVHFLGPNKTQEG
jgi:single-strand DNA-binding protein